MSTPKTTETEGTLAPSIWFRCAIVGLLMGLGGMGQGLWTHDLTAIGFGLTAISFTSYTLYAAAIKSGYINQNGK